MFARKDLNFIKLQMQVSVKGHHGREITIFYDFKFLCLNYLLIFTFDLLHETDIYCFELI